MIFCLYEAVRERLVRLVLVGCTSAISSSEASGSEAAMSLFLGILYSEMRFVIDALSVLRRKR